MTITKEEALAAIKVAGTTTHSLLVELLNNGTTKTIDNVVFKATGHVNLYLMAKNVSDIDSKYIEIYWESDH